MGVRTTWGSYDRLLPSDGPGFPIREVNCSLRQPDVIQPAGKRTNEASPPGRTKGDSYAMAAVSAIILKRSASVNRSAGEENSERVPCYPLVGSSNITIDAQS